MKLRRRKEQERLEEGKIYSKQGKQRCKIETNNRIDKLKDKYTGVASHFCRLWNISIANDSR